MTKKKDSSQSIESVVESLTNAMKGRFGEDQKRIDHALAVLNYAKQIFPQTKGDPKVVFAAALLHDIGIQEAEKKHGSSAGVYQEKEGPPIARLILKGLDFNEEEIKRTCFIIANHHSGAKIDTPDFNVIWDADWIVNIPDVFPNATPEQLAGNIDRILKTKIGNRMAKNLYATKEAKGQ